MGAVLRRRDLPERSTDLAAESERIFRDVGCHQLRTESEGSRGSVRWSGVAVAKPARAWGNRASPIHAAAPTSRRQRPRAKSTEPSSTRTRPSSHSHAKDAPVNASVEVAASGADVVAVGGVVEVLPAGVAGGEPPELPVPPEPVVVAVGLVTGLVATT